MIKQLEAIKFASDWNRQSQEPGIKIFKKEFVKKTFEMDPTCRHLRPNGTYEEQAAYKKAFVAFKLKHGKMITARNYLFRLYKQVIALQLFPKPLSRRIFFFQPVAIRLQGGWLLPVLDILHVTATPNFVFKTPHIRYLSFGLLVALYLK